MSPALWLTFLGVLITAVFGFLGARSSARASRAAANRAARLEEFKIQIDMRDRQVDSWREDTETLRRMHSEDTARLTACERRVATLSAQIDALTVWVGSASSLMRGAGVPYSAPTLPTERE